MLQEQALGLPAEPGRFAFSEVPHALVPRRLLRGIETPITALAAKEFQMIIRAKDFRSWFNANLRASAQDIANHGADSGFPCITYTSDTVKLFDRFEDEIWNMAVEQAEILGCKNVAEMIAGFNRADMLNDIDTFKNLMVWFACETLAQEIAP